MENGIDNDAPLDYATIQIFPAQNRYEIFVCGGDEVEKLSTGVLEHMLPHLPGVNKLYAKGLNAIFKLQVTGEQKSAEWFTKATLKRFLQFTGTSDLWKTIKNIEQEIIQLEEARKFHLSLYAKGKQNQLGSEGSDGFDSTQTSSTLNPDVRDTSADSSKNELLRAMDLRLTALRTQLSAAVKENAGSSTYCSEEITNLVQFCEHFGATDLKNSLSKFLEPIPKSETDLLVNDEKTSLSWASKIDSGSITNGGAQKTKPSPAVTPVKYGVSPAKVARVERQSSTESEESSESSDEKQVSAERSRSVTRSAQARRSASPMRRVQIGRSGPRRAPAVAIKSLGFYPTRDRVPSHIDATANSSEDEGSKDPGKKPENHVRRMSVQDAINLFESKQKDQSANIRNSSSNIPLFTNKSVLRRWSAGVADSAPHKTESVSESSPSILCSDEVVTEGSKDSMEERLESDSTSKFQNTDETREDFTEQLMQENGEDDPVNLEPESPETDLTQRHENNGKLSASTEWSRQKEAEFNQILKKMMEIKPERTRRFSASMVQSVSSEKRGGSYNHYREKRGGSYNHYREKRDQKLRGENTGKKAEQESQTKAMQQVLDEKKAQMASTKSKDAVKRNPVRRTQKSLKDPFQPANIGSDSPKTSVAKKVPSKPSTLPATRKSWPSAPSATRVAASSPSKIPGGTSSAGTTPMRRKPQSATSVPRSDAKVEKSQPRQRDARGSQTDPDRNLKSTKEKVQQTKTKNEKTTKTTKPTKLKVADSGAECHDAVPSKPSFYNKMTKKSTVVPLESKPRKGSGMGPGAVPSANKIKHSSQLDESSIKPKSIVEAEKIDVAGNHSVEVTEQPNLDCSSTHVVAALESVEPISNHDGDENENVNEIASDGNVFKCTADSPASIEPQEESIISPTAWVEIEEQCELNNSYDNVDAADASQNPSLEHVAPADSSSPCIRHSLSQMLQEESYESDTIEWGNAENPPSMIYQKDAPKGLKRLLKFARKTKGDTNTAGWSSPSVISEGEDDAEESEAVGKRNTENLLRKAALHSKIHGQPKTLLFPGNKKNTDVFAQSRMSKPDAAWSSRKSQKGHVSDATSTTKATKSFFSLSAFRGNKPSEIKFQ